MLTSKSDFLGTGLQGSSSSSSSSSFSCGWTSSFFIKTAGLVSRAPGTEARPSQLECCTKMKSFRENKCAKMFYTNNVVSRKSKNASDTIKFKKKCQFCVCGSATDPDLLNPDSELGFLLSPVGSRRILWYRH